MSATAVRSPAARAAEFAEAGPADEAELRALLRRTPMEGAARVGFWREPDYFAADGLAGGTDRTIVARRDGRIVCMGRGTTHTLFVNGRPERATYLSALRLARGVAGGMELLRGGYRFYHEAATGEGAAFCYTSIAADNARGLRVLERGGRLGLPSYRPLAELVTTLAPVGRGGADAPGADADREELGGFLRGHSERRHLGLVWDEACWRGLARHGVGPGSFAVVRRRGRIVAAGAVWDQRAYRQTIVHGYSPGLRVLRPCLNVLLACVRLPALPAPGAVLAQGVALGVAADDAAARAALWDVLRRRAAGLGLDWLATTRDAADTESAVAFRGAREYRTRLYEVRWPEAAGLSPDGRPFGPEAGLL